MPNMKPLKLVNRGGAGLLVKGKGDIADDETFDISKYKKNNIGESLRSLAVDIASLIPDPMNARRHNDRNLRAIRMSLALYGQVKPLVVRKGTNVVMAGNGTLEAAKSLGWTKIAAAYFSMSDVDAAGYGLADNRSAELATWDFEVVKRIEAIQAGALKPMVGWSVQEVLAMRAFGWVGQTDADEVPDLAEKETAITKVGDLWLLGKHRLVCGDCTGQKQVKRLMGGKKATLIFTDPPYGVAIAAKNRLLNSVQKAGRCLVDIRDDTISPDDLKQRLLPAFVNLRTLVAADDCTVFSCSPQGGELCMMMTMMTEAGLAPRHVIIWVKNQPTFSMGRLDYDYQHEPVLMTWGKRHKRLKAGKHQTSVWTIPKPTASANHPTMKPVELVVNAIENHTDPGDLVADVYLGSGTTLIAAQQTGRACLGMEIEPRYCDVALRRWAAFTSLDPIREDGIAFSALEAEKATPSGVAS